MDSLPMLIGDLAANNQTAFATVPGVTPQIIGAGVGALFEAYSIGFRFVWIAAGCFMVLAAVCRSSPPVQGNETLFLHFNTCDANLFFYFQALFSLSIQSKSSICISTHLQRRRKICSDRPIAPSLTWRVYPSNYNIL